jgi:hypothetical protein
MLNRTLTVDVVKKGKSHEDEINQSEAEFDDKAKSIGVVIGQGIKQIGYVICAYVVLDTVRKVVVASITPE